MPNAINAGRNTNISLYYIYKPVHQRLWYVRQATNKQKKREEMENKENTKEGRDGRGTREDQALREQDGSINWNLLLQ